MKEGIDPSSIFCSLNTYYYTEEGREKRIEIFINFIAGRKIKYLLYEEDGKATQIFLPEDRQLNLTSVPYLSQRSFQ